MNVSFVTSEPHGRARPLLDELLSNGTGRVMVACAFCTGAGVAIMRRHLARLRAPGSCLIVSADNPTDIDAVNELARDAPGAVWMHQTGKLPYERKVGSALMHSKVFYAEAGGKCWLWVGSHNLTARATEGANLEAAILLTGDASELPFVSARRHIEDCRSESSLCPFELPPLPDGFPVDVVVINAETERLPPDSFPWHVRLGLRSADYDWLLRPVAQVRLHLYEPGALAAGWKLAMPIASYHGTLTGLNLTEMHPHSPGIPGRWSEEHYSIVEERNVLQLSHVTPSAGHIVTQAVINIEGNAPSDEAFLSARPKAEAGEKTSSYFIGKIDPDIGEFFSRESVRDGQLVYQINQRGDLQWAVPIEDLRPGEQGKLGLLADNLRLKISSNQEKSSNRVRHPMIMRAKYQLWLDQDPS